MLVKLTPEHIANWYSIKGLFFLAILFQISSLILPSSTFLFAQKNENFLISTEKRKSKKKKKSQISIFLQAKEKKQEKKEIFYG